jgi:hypothetical protein
MASNSKMEIEKFNGKSFELCFITEISSARGDKNSASSKQKRSHSWHKVNSTAQQKGQNYTKWPKNCKALYILWARARMRVTASYKARICAQGAAVWRKTRAPAKRRIY